MSHHWFLLHISGMKADKNIISSVPGPLGMSPPGPTRKKKFSEQISPVIQSLYLKNLLLKNDSQKQAKKTGMVN